MAKKIAYTITSSGVDGREPTKINEAFWDEKQRDTVWSQMEPNRQTYFAKSEMIVDVENAIHHATAKLNGLDRLVLEIENIREC
jgi:hypothetical protein